MPKTYQDDKPKPKCKLAEIVQYDCELNIEGRKVLCKEVPRIFRLCEGRPAMEITAFVHFDPKTGDITLPDLTSDLPQGKKWRDLPQGR